MDQNEAKPYLLQSFQSGNPIGARIQCYYNPKDPNEIVRHKSSKEDYNKLVLNSMAWSLGIVVLGIVVIVTAGCVVSCMRSREGYERIADQNQNVQPLQYTVWSRPLKTNSVMQAWLTPTEDLEGICNPKFPSIRN